MNKEVKTLVHCINTDVTEFCLRYKCDIYDFICEVLDKDHIKINIC